MNNCRIKRILDSIDPEILEKLLECMDDTDIGVPKKIIELYLKGEYDAKKEKADSRKSD